MRKVLLGLVFGATVWAQTATPNVAAAGVSYGSSVAGTAMYARAVDSVGTYSFTVVDAVPSSAHPLTVTTQVATGIAQRLFCSSTNVFCAYIPGAAGVSWSGSNTGWSWSTGGLLAIKPTGWKAILMPNVRMVKSSVNNNSGYQVIGGLMIGWGW